MDFLILHEDPSSIPAKLYITLQISIAKNFKIPNLKIPFNNRHLYFNIPQKDIQGNLPNKLIQVMKHGNSIHCSTLDLASLNARNRSAAKECYLRKELCLEGMALRLCIVPSYHAFKMMYATALISALPVVAVACVLPYSKGFKALSCVRFSSL
ncbi:DNA mismatch repair protein MSH4 [Tanacetum coccineum]